MDIINGEWVYHGELFTGEIKELFPGGKILSIRPVAYGRQQGLALRFYEDGKPESRRWYTKGEKDSVHTGWWPNGNKKFEYHFRNGVYNGTFTEWYASGKMIQQVNYENGKDISGKGWRENGKLYMSYIMKDGRRYGLYNANLCYPIKKDSNIKTKGSIK